MKTQVYPVGLRNLVRTILVCAACWLLPTVAKADTPIPTSVSSNYDPVLKRLTLTVTWYWGSTSNSKHVTAAVFADLNGDGISPTYLDDPATYNSGGNPFPAGLLPRDEFLGQLAASNIEGSATSSIYTDNTDNGIAAQNGFGPNDPRVLFPYGLTPIGGLNSSTGTFTMTYTNVLTAPSRICVIMYDVHTGDINNLSGNHSPRSANPGHNGDNSAEDGNDQGTVSCTGLSNLQCASNKTESSCQTQAAIDASYAAWLNSATASGCNGVLTHNGAGGAPSRCGGSRTVTWTYTQNGCPNQAAVTTCTATFTVIADNTPPVFISCPAGGDLGCNPNGVPPAGTPTATDNCANSTITYTSTLGPVVVNGNQRSQTRTYTATDACGNSTSSTACQQVFTWTVCAETNPDFNSTYVNVHVTGNVSTNDKVPAGSTYCTNPPLASSPAGSVAGITMNSNGTYDFVANMPGVYTYNVCVCVPGQAQPCPTTPLVITVLDSGSFSNPPVANVDIATTKVNTPVTLLTLANDAAGNPGNQLVPSTVTIVTPPLHGTVTVNSANGNTTYTPTAGYIGSDTLTYQVCDDQSPAKCATAKQVIRVVPANADNSTVAGDDYKITPINTPASGNVSTNDSDPEGEPQTVTAQPGTTVPGKGTLVLSSNGSYTFTPVNGFTGPVDFTYTTCDNHAPPACASATLHILVRPEAPQSNPDFNSTFVNVPVPGNVSTNDKVPPGTTYCTNPPLVSSPAGSTATLSINNNGSYSFVANMPGVYTYNVCYCVPGAVAPCPTTPLVITVLNPLVVTNPPVANVDIATTPVNTPVTLNTLANDQAGNPGNSLVPSSVTIVTPPVNGTVTVNPANGNTTYTPNPGFIGSDTLTYQVCDNQSPPKCATAKQVIVVRSNGLSNTTVAADDYKITQVNTPASGNVSLNDSDPEGNIQTVVAQPGTVAAGKGTLVLAPNGGYTFTPVAGYTGPVDFVYTTCDNGVPSACASATLHILVRPEAPLANPDFNSTFVNVHVTGDVRTNDFVPAGTTYGTSPALTSSPAGSVATLVMNANGTYDFVANMIGVYKYAVPVCVPGQVAPCPTTELTITVLDPNTNTNGPVANVDLATTMVGMPVVIKTLANDAAGSPTTALVPGSVTVTVAALHGTSSINAATGDNTYTPAPGFVGFDTLTYQVCDNQGVPKCASAKQIIWVKAPGMVNTTSASDDYAITNLNTAVSGNVKINDTDAEGNAQTVNASTITIPTKGTFTVAANGDYTFTPIVGFSGPVDFVYTTCDNGVPVACAQATVHILVRPAAVAPDLSPNITAIPNIMHGTTNFNVTVKVQELLGNPTDGSTILIRIPRDPRVTFTYNPALVTVGFTAVNNSVWTYDGTDPIFHLFRTNTIIPGNGSSTFGFQATFTPGQSQGKYTLSSSLNSGSGGEIITNNNQDAEVIDYFIN